MHIICPACEATFVEDYIGDAIWDKEFICPLCNATIMAIETLGHIEVIKEAPVKHKELEWRKTKVKFLKVANGGRYEEEHDSKATEEE